MWLLTHVNTGENFYIFHERSSFTVGRLGSDFVIKDDKSISRSHAKLYLNADKNLLLTDVGSKYGTFINSGIETKTSLIRDKDIELHDGDLVRFGQLNSDYRVMRQDIVTMTSSLPKDKSEEVERHVKALDGRIITKWENCCTHLTMSEITVTIKVLYALIEQIPIVSDKYWKDYLEIVRNHENKQIPSVSAYIPNAKTSESFINKSYTDFNLNPKRKNLFAGKTFVFMCKKHYDMYSEIVMKAGGACKSLNNGVQKSFLIKKNVIVIQYTPSSQSQCSQNPQIISDYIESKHLRTIPEYEIGLAIINCSMEKFCNPTQKIIDILLPQSTGIDQNSEILVENTRLFTRTQTNSIPNIEVPETEESNHVKIYIPSEVFSSNPDSSFPLLAKLSEDVELESSTQSTNKRRRSNSRNNDDIQCSKKQAINQVVVGSNSGSEQTESIEETKTSTDFQTEKHPVLIKSNKRIYETENLDEVASPSKIQKHSNITDANALEDLPDNHKGSANKTKSKTYVNTLGFLQKSQIRNTQKSIETELFEPAIIDQPRKRGKIAKITEDIDENDLFDFGSRIVTKSPIDHSNAAKENSDEELLTFEKRKDASKPSNDALAPLITKVRQMGEMQVINLPKITPIKITSDGWLSRESIKIETKEEITNDEKDQQHKEYVESIKVAFEVRLRNLQITPREVASNSQNSSSNRNCKNFKAFVKKYNYKPQRQVISTSSVPVLPIH